MIRCKTIHTSWGTSKQIDGQMSISDYLEIIKPHKVIIKGLCDDAYCPECNYEFWTDSARNEVDCAKCPSCGIRIDWTPWHKLNDEEAADD